MVAGALCLCLIGGVIGVRVLRSVQQARLVSAARTAGLAAHQRGAPAETLEQLSYYIQHVKDDVEALLAFADARRSLPLADGRHLAEALGLYKESLRLLELDPAAAPERRAQVLNRLMELYGQVGMRFEQIKAAERILEESPRDAGALAARAVALFRERRFDESLRDAQTLARLEPASLAWPQLELEILNSQGRSEQEIDARCRQWIEERPDDPRPRLLRAGALAVRGRLAEARAEAAAAVERGADTLEVLQAMVSLLDQLEMRSEAAGVIADATRNFPQAPWVRLALADRAWQAGDLEQARRVLDAARRDLGSLDEGLTRLEALVAQGLGDHARAGRALGELRQRAGGDPVDDTLRAWVDAVEGATDAQRSWEERLQRIEHALLLSPADPVLHLLMGQASASAAEHSRAIDGFRAAATLAPQWVAAGRGLVEALMAAGRPDEALVVAGRMLRQADPSVVAPYIVFARAHLAVLERGGEPHLVQAMREKAEDVFKIFESVAAVVPDQPDIAQLVVELHLRRGDRPGAAAFMEGVLTRPDAGAAVLLTLAEVSRLHGLGLESRFLERAAAAGAPPLLVAVSQASVMADAGDFRAGLEHIDNAMRQSGGEAARSWPARQARALFLLRSGHPEGVAELRRLAHDFAASATAQSFVLGMPQTWEDEALVRQTLDRLRACVGERAETVRLAEAKARIKFRAHDEAALAEAVMLLSEVLQEAPDSLAAHTFMAEAALAGPRPAPRRAIEHLERALSAAPGHAALYPWIIRLLQDVGDFERAQTYLQRLAGLQRDDASLRTAELRLLQRQGDFQSAMVRASQTFGQETDDENAQLALAAMHARAGERDAAEAIHRRLLEGPAPSVAAVNAAAEFQARSGRFKQGLQLLMDLADSSATRPLLIGGYHRRHGDPADAAEWLEQALARDPRSPEAHLEMARLELDLGRRPGAREHALRGLALEPGHVGLRAVLALTNEGESGRTETIALLREVAPQDDDLLAVLLLLERVPRDPATPPAEALLRDALRLIEEHGTFLPAWELAIRLHHRAGRAQEAVDLAQRAVARFPAEPEPAMWATQLLSQQRRWPEALVEAQAWRRRALEEPLAPDATIAAILLELGRAREAAERLVPHAATIERQRDRHPQRFMAWMRALLAGGRSEMARPLIEPLLRGEGAWRARWLELARLLEEPHAVTALRMVPDDAVRDAAEMLQMAMAWSDLAERSTLGPGQRQEHFASAVTWAERAAGAPGHRLDAILVRGAIAAAAGDYQTAERLYREVLSRDPDDPAGLNNLAFALSGLDRHAEALPHVERALRARPGEPDLLDTHALVLARLGRLDEAERSAAAAAGARPGDPGLWLHLAEVQAERGRTADAGASLAEVERALASVAWPKRDHAARAASLRARLGGRENELISMPGPGPGARE
jgi:tetratricopeptide (TPR) repeat protein